MYLYLGTCREGPFADGVLLLLCDIIMHLKFVICVRSQIRRMMRANAMTRRTESVPASLSSGNRHGIFDKLPRKFLR